MKNKLDFVAEHEHSLLSRRSLRRQCIYLHLYLALSLQRNHEAVVCRACWQSSVGW